MVCLGLEPRAAGWKVQTNPLSYGGTPCCSVLFVVGCRMSICQSNQNYIMLRKLFQSILNVTWVLYYFENYAKHEMTKS